MPFYVAEYLADTGHLTTAQHGAYMLLIMHYWRRGGLPTDDASLARIAKMSKAEWRSAKPAIEPLFLEGWKHKRVEFELTESARISEAGRKGGHASGKSRSKNKDKEKQTHNLTTVERPLNDQRTIREALPSPSHLPIDDDDDRRPADFKEANAVADQVAELCGHSIEFLPPSWFGAAYRVQSWLTQGWPRDLIIASVREQLAKKRDGPPNRIEYFEKGIASAIARNAAPLPAVVVREAETVEVRREADRRSGGSLVEAADRLIGKIAEFNRPAPDSAGTDSICGGEGATVVRLLPKG